MSTRKTCSQCGRAWTARACGPSHAIVAAEIKHWSSMTRRLKQRIARVAWKIPADTRRGFLRDVNTCIDEWAGAEHRRAK